MHISVLQENLLPILQDSLKFVSSKPQLPILSGVMIQTTEGKIIIRTTDIKVGFQTILGGKIKEEGECVVPGKIFLDFINTLHPGVVELIVDQDKLKVIQKETIAKLQTFPSNDYPPFPQPEGETSELDTQIISAGIDQVSYAASLDETRPVLTAMEWKIESTVMIMASTDGYRLAVSKVGLNEEKSSQKILIHAKTAQEIIHILTRVKEKKVSFGISESLAQVFFKFGNTLILVRLIEGEFPEYERIIPHGFKVECKMNKEQLMSAIKTALVFARESSSIITLFLKDNICRLKSASTNVGENEGSVDIVSSIIEEEKKISFNGKFLLDSLSHISSEFILFCMNDELKPALVKNEDSEYPIAVIMPFKR